MRKFLQRSRARSTILQMFKQHQPHNGIQCRQIWKRENRNQSQGSSRPVIGIRHKQHRILFKQWSWCWPFLFTKVGPIWQGLVPLVLLSVEISVIWAIRVPLRTSCEENEWQLWSNPIRATNVPLLTCPSHEDAILELPAGQPWMEKNHL